jgi:hypothetical protein
MAAAKAAAAWRRQCGESEERRQAAANESYRKIGENESEIKLAIVMKK